MVKRCRPARVWMPAQNSRSTLGLLYPVAVRDDRCEQEHCQGPVDIGLSAWELACYASLITVFAAQRLFALSVSARYRPSQTLPSGTQGARPADDHYRRNTVMAMLASIPVSRRGGSACDRLLRRSFHAAGQLATFLVRVGLLNFWLQLNVSGFRPVLARGWHGAHIRASWQWTPVVR
jgi:hypothetical protein